MDDVPDLLRAVKFLGRRKLARIFDAVMRSGWEYQKRSETEFAKEHRQRMENNLHRRAREMGDELKKIEPATAEQSSPA